MRNRELTNSLEQLHTTDAGAERIKKNLGFAKDNIIKYCQSVIKNRNTLIYKMGKNYYVCDGGSVFTINASSKTIITAHKENQIERITKFEKMMDEAEDLFALEHKDERFFELLDALDAYYQSLIWKQDFADDEAGLLPPNLERGVLSEDGIYNLLEDRYL